jgi:hypothetical protein
MVSPSTRAATFRPLFVTSFGFDMYMSTGVHLVMSFFMRDIPASLLVCHEQRLGTDVVALPPRLLTYDLDGSEVLYDWLKQNRDIIPKPLGGDAERCGCPEPDNVFGPHQPRCCWSWFNKNASRWFRKIVSLNQALTLRDFDAIIWIDSDCRFITSVTAEEIECWFGRSSAFFLKGKRKVLESGIIGFRLDEGGQVILRHVIDKYRSGSFRHDLRWDDSYQFLLAIRQHPEVPVTDWGGETVGDGHVVSVSRLGQYIDHAKGLHRVTGIMT